ncbi:cell surface protein SprA [Flavobacterium branchiophilum]
MFFLMGLSVMAQVDSTKTAAVKDTLGYHKGKIALSNPPTIVEAYSYDPIGNQYILTSKVAEFSIKYPTILSPAEYRKLVLKESMHDYFKKKADAMDGKKEGSEAAKKNLLPRYYINSGLFSTIFGSNTIDIKPTGSVELDLGLRYTKQDNPALTPQNRATTTFDFNQRISVGLKGKVGTRLNVNMNYDTQSTFSFQNLIKLEFNPSDILADTKIPDLSKIPTSGQQLANAIPKSFEGKTDDILQKLEIGNISMPLSGSLIRGAQSLFGVKAQFKFGRTTITGLYSEQKSETKSVTSQNGATVQEFNLFALDYDADRHFFLSQYFRNQYDKVLKSYPILDTRVHITRVEVWVTNRQNRINTTENNSRNIVALQDLGESELTNVPNEVSSFSLTNTITPFFMVQPNSPADNKNNKYDPALIALGGGILDADIRTIATINDGFNGFAINPSEGRDWVKLENARKLTASEFTFHPQLGYISLQQRLTNDEVLAVAYQYTIGDELYQVGEFANDGVNATNVDNIGIPSTQSLVLKMLKSSLTNVTQPVWNLMMKNIYQIQGAYQLTPQDFKFNIVYSDPSPLNYIKPVGTTPFPANPSIENRVAETPLLKVFNMDKLNFTNDPQPGGDGFFDFLPGITVDAQNARVIFTTVEPFGKTIFDKLGSTEDYYNTTSYNPNQAKYVFRSLYTGTQTQALQDAEKNKYQLKGKFKSSSGDGIPLGAINVPKGSVVVTAGGRVLQEGIDYTVNYQQGRVQILDPSLQASGIPIQVSVENNSIFGQQTRQFYGLNVEHKFSDNFVVGGTFLRMSERPFTQKSAYGQESVNNTIFGFNTSYTTEVPLFTRLVNQLPNMDTDVKSNLSFKGEVAFLKPDTPNTDKVNGESTIYVDDFEGNQSTIDMKASLSWSMSSTPIFDGTQGFPDFGASSTNIDYGFKRALINWYTIDPTFYIETQAGTNLNLNKTRRIYNSELFPDRDLVAGQTTVISTFDLSYYPNEKGPYNANPNFATSPFQNNFGGLTRAINTTNFEQANVEYIQFWVMDPFVDTANPTEENPVTNKGKLFFNLGEISEDILQDGKKQYENGLPTPNANTSPTSTSIWGKVPASQSLIYAFDAIDVNRESQDVGLDGLTDTEEAAIYNNTGPDPAGDNYQFFLSATGTVLDRYKKYNNPQGNSPVTVSNTDRGSATLPDVEDLNRDNTMNTINAYYEYSIDIDPTKMHVGNKYVVDEKEIDITLNNGNITKTHWVQYKIPIVNPERIIGGISDFRSIRFMRMFMTGFSQPVTMRFGTLDLSRGEWRRYTNSMDATDNNLADDNTALDVLGVDIIENSNRTPIPYVSPPGVVREQVYNNNSIIRQNEKALSLKVAGTDGLEAGDLRGVFKNVSVDMRQYKNLKMFLHAESIKGEPELKNDEMIGFIRFGNDFTQNYYQIEIPLKVTAPTARSAEEIWPEDNQIDLNLALLTKIKVLAMGNNLIADVDGIKYLSEAELDPANAGKPNLLKIGIKGNPNFGEVRNLMVGIKNNTKNNPILNAKSIKGEVWFNELRLAGIDNKGGMAAIASLDTNFADLATLSATGKMSTIGFGALEQSTNERSREDLKLYDIVTNINIGKLLPKKWKVNLPFNYAVGEQFITPKFDPFNQDIELKQLIDITADANEKNNLLNRAIDYTKRKSINFIGVKKEKGEKSKPHVYDFENLTLSYSYNQTEHHDYEIESLVNQQVKTTVDYSYTFQPKAIEPFKKVKMLKSSYLKLLQDFNFNYLPSNINFSSNILRQYNKQQFRQVDVNGIGLDPLYRRNYTFNYQYGFNYNLTKALKLNFTASSNNIVRNFSDENKIADPNNTIWTDYWNIGDPNQHNQQLTVNYELPLNKIPFLAFIKSSYTYTGTYSWQRASDAMASFEAADGQVYNLGNTIQNSAAHKLNVDFNMDTFYKYIGLTKQKKAPKPNPTPKAPPKPGEKIVNTNVVPAKDTNVFLDGLIGVLTSVKNLKVDYTQNSGAVLPGYLPSIGFLGSSRPSMGFVFGLQDEVRFAAAQNGWLTNYPNFNQNFTQVTTKNLKVTANIDLFPDFKIDINADRIYAENHSEQYDIVNGQYNARSPYMTGNFAISTVMLKTSFKASDEIFSSAFNDFKHNRLIIANRLATSHYGSPLFPTQADGYPVGFGKNSQDVLLPAFLAAYTGFTSAGIGTEAAKISFNPFKNIPLPNWNVKYNGLMRFKYFKEHFKRFSIQHAYKSSYTINNFRSNLEYSQNPNGTDKSDNFFSKTSISNVNLVEQFNPLMRVDFETKNGFKILAEMKKDRALSLSFDNSLLTEVRGFDYVFGVGYRIKDVALSSKFADNAQGIIKSDINIKADFSLRDTKTIVRQLDYNNNLLAGGQKLMSIKLTADYAFSRYLTAIFFYDHTFTKAVISTAFPMTNIRSGFTLRYSFGN